MESDIAISLSRDEAIVLFEFFWRFQETNQLRLRHNAEFLALSEIAAQIQDILVEPLQSDYLDLLRAAQSRLSDGFEGLAPGVEPLGTPV